MALAFVLVGVMLVASGIKNTQGQLGALIVSDFTGAGNFWYYIAGIFAVGTIGYYQPARDISRLLIVLILLVLFLSNEGIWAQLQSGLATAQAAPSVPQAGPTGNLIGAALSAGQAAAGASPILGAAQSAGQAAGGALFNLLGGL
jgi:hypothetical protein